jgi:hypothetical protein
VKPHEIFVSEKVKSVAGHKNEKKYIELIERFSVGLSPWVDADYPLFQSAYRACKDQEFGQLSQLARAAGALYETRSAQAFNGSVLINGVELAGLPSQFSAEADAARSTLNDLRSMAAKGLGLKIPIDMPVNTYVELIRDYQPRITAAIDAIVPDSPSDAAVADLQKYITAMNAEIERIKGTKRYAFFEVCSGLYRNNAMLLGGILLATALGLSGSLLGCAVTGAVTAGTKVAKKKGWVNRSRELDRLGKMIARDLQPYTDKLLSTYFGSETPTINVMSMQRRIEKAQK